MKSQRVAMENGSAGTENRLVSVSADGAVFRIVLPFSEFACQAMCGRSIRILLRLRFIVPAALLGLLTVCTGAAIAGEKGEAAEPAEIKVPDTAVATEHAEAGPSDDSTAFGRAADKTHDALERNILEQVIRLDNFFGNVKTEIQQKDEYQLSWRNSLRVEEGGNVKLGTTLWANIKLLRINERLRFVIAGENEPAPLSSRLPEDPGNPGFDRNSPTPRFVNTELRYDLVQTPSLNIFLGAGARFIVPPEAFVRSRLQYTHKLSDAALFRFAETLFYKNFEVLGETSEIYLERLLDKKTLLRWATIGTVSSEIEGVEWGTELSLIRELSPRRGITLTGGVYGNTRISAMVQNYRILARYRQNFLRSWLFYELEPEITWPRRADNSFPSTLALTFRIEVVFQGKEK